MQKYFYTFILLIGGMILSHAQIVMTEDFEADTFPSGWSQITNASDNGWKIGTSEALSSQYWSIADNGSLRIAATNDDGCNCDKSNDYLITPPLNFTSLSSVAMSVDIFFGMGTYESFTEQASIEVSTDKLNWTVIEEIHGHSGWDTHKIDLSDYKDEDSVYIAFHYSDNGGWLFGLAVDNIVVEVPPALDASLIKLKSLPYGLVNDSIRIVGTLFNNGITPITSLELNYYVNGNGPVSATIDSLDILPFTTYEFTHPVAWTPESTGDYDIQVEIFSVNTQTDEDSTNNVLTFHTEIFPKINPTNRIDEFLLTEPVFTTIASASDGLDKPNDLDFFPILAKNELWVVNERLENTGGNTLTIYDAGNDGQTFLSRTDGNAWHFMSMPTAISFSDNFNFGTSPGVKDANHSNGTFTGPTLWSSDPQIYAQPSGGNGSHLDMLHGSPFSMGIESEAENVFWVFDGWDGTIVRYDFQADHGPGNDDHSDGIVRRYSEIQVQRDGLIPNHLVLDKNTGWLYVVDNGNDRVLRLDIHTGSISTSLPLINEPLAEHSQMSNVTWEVIINDSLDRPSGIELIDNRLLVGDYANGDIIIYDIENGFSEMGRIRTGQPGLTGIKIGPDGAIWYTNSLQNTLRRIEPGEVTGISDDNLLNVMRVSPNPTSGVLQVDLNPSFYVGNTRLSIFDAVGQELISYNPIDSNVQLDLSDFPDGIYFLYIKQAGNFAIEKIILQR